MLCRRHNNATLYLNENTLSDFLPFKFTYTLKNLILSYALCKANGILRALHAFCAASLRANFLEVPWPWKVCPSISTAITNMVACSGPVREIKLYVGLLLYSSSVVRAFFNPGGSCFLALGSSLSPLFRLCAPNIFQYISSGISSYPKIRQFMNLKVFKYQWKKNKHLQNETLLQFVCTSNVNYSWTILQFLLIVQYICISQWYQSDTCSANWTFSYYFDLKVSLLPVESIFISLRIQYAQAYSSYKCFILINSNKLSRQGYTMEHLKFLWSTKGSYQTIWSPPFANAEWHSEARIVTETS